MATQTTETENRKPKHPRQSNAKFRCKVHRLNEERENASFPISVFVIGKKKKVFSPGTEVDLMDYHIEVLRNAVDETEIEIPQESGIYEAANPTRVAENNFPGFRASVSEVDGTITMRRSIPKYSVEIIKPLE